MKFKPVTDEAVKEWIMGLEFQEVVGESDYYEFTVTSGICDEDAEEGTEERWSFWQKHYYRFVVDFLSEWRHALDFASSFKETSCSDWAYFAVAAVKGSLIYIVTASDEEAAKNRHWDVWAAEGEPGDTFLHRERTSWLMMKPIWEEKEDLTVLDEEKVLRLRKPLVRGEQSFTEITIRVESNSYWGDQTPPSPGGPILVFEKTFSLGVRRDGTMGIYEGPTRGDYPYHYGDTRVLAVDGDTIWVSFSYDSAFQVNAKEGYCSSDGCTTITTNSSKLAGYEAAPVRRTGCDTDAETENVESDGKLFEIEDGIFSEYYGDATELVLPDTVTRVGGDIPWDDIDNDVYDDRYDDFDEEDFEREFFPIKGCGRIKTIHIPASVTEIKEFAFCKCKALENIVVSEENAHYRSIDGKLYSKDGKELIFVPKAKKGKLLIPDGVTKLGRYCCEKCAGLTEVVCPEGLKEIGKAAFRSCGSLTNVVLREGLLILCTRAFEDCRKLGCITLPDSLRDIPELAYFDSHIKVEYRGKEYGHKDMDALYKAVVGDFHIIDGMLKKYNGSAENVVIPRGVREIGMQAFYETKNVKRVVIPDGVESIGTKAFWFCWDLKEVVLPRGLREIGCEAFQCCFSLEKINFPEGLRGIRGFAFHLCRELENVSLPESLEWIESDAFRCCGKLLEIKLPDQIKCVGKNAFDVDAKIVVTYLGREYQAEELGEIYEAFCS